MSIMVVLHVHVHQQCWVVTAGGVYCLIAVYSNIKIMAVINLISIIFTVMEYNANNAKWVKVEEQLRKMEAQLLNYKTTLLKVRGGGGGGGRAEGWLACLPFFGGSCHIQKRKPHRSSYNGTGIGTGTDFWGTCWSRFRFWILGTEIARKKHAIIPLPSNRST